LEPHLKHDRATRLYFATDIHGSEICWRKFLAAAAYYEAGTIVLGGDMTGKALVPIVRKPAGGWRAVLLQQEYRLETEEEARRMEASISSRGYYPIRVDDADMESFAAEPSRIDVLFRKTVLQSIGRWMEIADAKLAGSGVHCFVCPGNDDAFEIDAVIAGSKSVIDGEGRTLELAGGFSLSSTGWSNPTPWRTHRETGEEALYARIVAALPADLDPSRAVFNLHAPPYATGLDDAPELDEDLNVLNAGQSVAPVGSKSVRRVIEERRPILSLHGHIHEAKGVARIGKTLCVNPGSLYEQGVLQGALVDLDPRKGVRSYVLTTG
jgi:Icc-related predicted phosphoesterase